MTLTEQMKADGWIEHDGGPCPVKGPVVVMYRTGDQFKWKDAPAEDWTHQPTDALLDIIAYKPEQPQ